MFRNIKITSSIKYNIQNYNEKVINIMKIIATNLKNKAGTVAEKWLIYLKNVRNDYRDVALDACYDIKSNPLKTAVIFSSMGFLYYCAQHNPNEASFKDDFIKSANKVHLVHPKLQRKETVDHLQRVENCYSKKLIRRLNMGILSVMWAEQNGSSCNNYGYSCSHLQYPYLKFKENVIDIGFLGNWVILMQKMQNYDNNY